MDPNISVGFEPGSTMKIYAYNEYSLLFLKLIMYKRKINFALIIIIDAKIIKRTN